VLGLVTELALRVYLTNFGSEDDKIAYLYTRAEINKHKRSDEISLPFVQYGLSPDVLGDNALGYRGDEIQVPKPPGVYRIVVMGDSTTYGSYSPYDQTFPAYLQQVLRDTDGYRQVEVVNGGVTSYTSWNTLVNLALRVVELQPDLVIVYEGGNDVHVREVSPECYSAPTPYLGLDPIHTAYLERAELSPFALYRLIAVQLGWIQNPAQFINSLFDVKMPCIPPADVDTLTHNVETNHPTYFERNVRDMIGIAQMSGVRIMFSTWAYNPNDSNLKPYWRTAVAEHNAITARVAQENGVLFLDYAAAAPTDNQFWNDGMHLTIQGNLGQAQIFAQFLDAQGVIPKPTPAG
jgi:lysophospholipase L1-like esterase